MKWIAMAAGAAVVGVVAAIMLVSVVGPEKMSKAATSATTTARADGIADGDADGDKDAVIFEGYDSLWQTQTIIERRDGGYYLDGDKMEENLHRNMPTDGLALVLIDRIGEPDNYFLVRDGRMDIYTGCEYGPCSLKRTIRQ